MNILEKTKINLRKLWKYKTKAFYLILPVTFLVATSVVVTSQTQNVQKATDATLIASALEQSKLLELRKVSQTNTSSSGGAISFDQMIGSNSTFTASDLDKIAALAGVDKADMFEALAEIGAKTNNLIDSKNLSLSQFTALDPDFAALFTDQDFDYKEGDAIPIIINPNQLIEEYVDWGGKDKIEITFPTTASGGGQARRIDLDSSPLKRNAVEFDKDDLLGSEFEITFGGLDAIQDYKVEPTETGITYSKYTTEELAAQEQKRKDTISPYWDYEKIKTGTTYKFKIVGFTDGEKDFANYIPKAFAEKLMHDYFQKELDARTATAIPTDKLNSTFMGTTYDGTTLQTGMGLPGGFKAIRFGGPAGQEETPSYTIPGLIIETKRDTSSSTQSQQGGIVKRGGPGGAQSFSIGGASGTVVGEYKNANVFTESVKTSGTILIKLDSIYDRANVVAELNKLGYGYQDSNDIGVFTELKNNLDLISRSIIIAFIIICAFVVFFSMGKFVSENTKEIGILRAIGMKKGDVRSLFLFQAILYTLVGYVLGLAAGVGLNLLTSGVVKSWFDGFVNTSVKESFPVVNDVASSVFMALNWESILLITGITFVIAIVVSIIPANNAANVSPVVAIRSE